MSQTLSAIGGVPPYTRTAIDALPAGLSLDSAGVLTGEHDCYSALPFGYLRYSTFLREGEIHSEAWVSFTDGIMADVAFRLRVPPTQWDEVCIKFRDPLPDDLTPYAVTHPHATL